MFSLREYIKGGFIQAIGNKPNYEIKLKSAEWLSKGVLTEEDLAEIESAMESKNEVLKAEEENKNG